MDASASVEPASGVRATLAPNDIAIGYFEAFGRVSDAGYQSDIDWADDLRLVKPDARYVLREGAWVIVNSGFRYAVARKLWPRLLEAFHEFEVERVTDACLPSALSVLNHVGKMTSIVKLAKIVRSEGIGRILDDAKEPPKLTRLPWIGRITCWHYAKVLGVDVVKPDVHLVRAAKAAGYDTPVDLCAMIREKTGDRLTVVDSVLWRYGEQQQARGWPTWQDLFAPRDMESFSAALGR